MPPAKLNPALRQEQAAAYERNEDGTFDAPPAGKSRRTNPASAANGRRGGRPKSGMWRVRTRDAHAATLRWPDWPIA